MPAADTARLIASLELQDKNFTANTNKVLGGLDKLDARVQKSSSTIKTAFGTGLGFIGAQVTAKAISTAFRVLPGIVQKASDLAETQSKVNVVFGESSKEILAFGKNSATALGQSEVAALGAAATYGNLFVSMGIGTDKAAGMSTALVTLASDLASFNNIDPTEAAEKLRAGLTGESEPLKSLGININETIIKAKALELGLVKTGASTAEITLKTKAWNEAQQEAAEATKKYGAESDQALKAIVKADKAQASLEATTKKIPGTLDAATKAQAAYALIFEQSATAQGDFTRTSAGLANQQRILRAQIDNTAATIGTGLLPGITKIVTKINELVSKNQPAIAEFARTLPAAFDGLLAIVGQIPFEQIGTSLQIAGTGARVLLDAFVAMPPWVQTAVITGWGLNKLTGGALGGIVSELGKGLIRGVLGMNAGIVNINAAAVKGPGLLGDVAGGGGKFSFLNTALKVSVVGAVVVAGLEAGTALAGINDPRHQLTGGGRNRFGGTTFRGTNVRDEQIANLERSLSNLEERAAKGDKVAERQLAEINAELVRLRGAQADETRLSTFMASASKDDTFTLKTIQSSVAALASQSHADLERAIAALDSIDIPIGEALKGLVETIRGGAGGDTETAALVKDLEARRAAALAKGDKATADALADAIKRIEPFAKGRQWQAEQIAEARKIVASTKSAEEKTAALKGIQQDLLSNQRTMAANIVAGLLDVVTAVKNIKIGAVAHGQGGGAVSRENRPGFTPTPRPPSNVTSGGFDRRLVVTVNNSIRDQNTAKDVRTRVGPTPTEVGAA